MITIHELVLQKKYDELRELLALESTDVNTYDPHKNTALHYAAALGDLDIIEMLLSHSANTGQVDSSGYTPLLTLVQNGHTQYMQVFINYHADPMAITNSGMNLLHLAFRNCENSAAIENVLAFLNRKQTCQLIRATDYLGRNILHFAATKGRCDVIQVCLDNGIDLNACTYEGYTALHYAVQSNSKEAILTLLDNGASPYLINNNGDNPIHHGQRIGCVQSADLLHERSLQMFFSIPEEDYPIIKKIVESHIALNAYYDSDKKKIFSKSLTDQNQEGLTIELAFMNKQLMEARKIHEAILAATEFRYPMLTCYTLLEISETFLMRRDFQKAMLMASSANAYYKEMVQEPSPLMEERLKFQIKRVLIYFFQVAFRRYDALEDFDFIGYQKRLKKHRSFIKAQLNKTDINTESLLAQNTVVFVRLSEALFNDAIRLYGTLPPCQYAVIGLGSMGRNEMSLYSDLEFALIVTEDTAEVRRYFKAIMELMELMVVSLGETPATILSHQYSPTPTGYHFDEGGNTPLNSDFIGTIESLVKIQLKFNNDEYVIARNALRTACFIAGEKSLMDEYDREIQLALDNHISKSGEIVKRTFFNKNKISLLREHEAVNIMRGDLKEFSPHRLAQQKHDFNIFSFNIKTELYRLPSQTIANLSLFYGVNVKGTWKRLRALKKLGVLSNEAANQLSRLMAIVIRFRLLTHAHYETEQESLHHESMVDTIHDQREKQPYFIDDKITNTLVDLYSVLMPLYEVVVQFVKSYDDGTLKLETNPFSQTALNEKHDMVAIVAYERLFQTDKAKQMYMEAIQLNPDKIDIHSKQLNFLQYQRETLEMSIVENNKRIQLGIDALIVDFLDAETSYEQILALSEAFSIKLSQVFVDKMVVAHQNRFPNEASLEDLFEERERDASSQRYIDICEGIAAEKKLEQFTTLIEEINNFRPLTQKFLTPKVQEIEHLFELLPLDMRPVTGVLLLYLQNQLVRITERELEDFQDDLHRALGVCMDIIVRNYKDPAFYSHVYQKLRLGVRQGFRQHLLNYIQAGPEYEYLKEILRDLNTFPDESGNRDAWEQSKVLWRKILKQLINSSAKKNAKTIRLQSPLLDREYTLNPEIEKLLFKSQKKFQEQTISGSTHQVVAIETELGRLYVKANPEMPGMTTLIELFHHGMIGHGTCFSELVRFNLPKKKEPLPVTLSLGVEGPTLHRVLRDTPELLQRLDHRHYTELVFLAMLTNPEDGIPTNYIVTELSNGNITLVSVDHDHALFPAYLATGSSENEELQIKTILFCLDQIKKTVDPVARERFLALHPVKVLRSVLRDAQEQNRDYQQLFDPKTIKNFYKKRRGGSTAIPIPIKRGDIAKIYQKLVRLQTLLKAHEEVTLLQCLLHIEPRVGLVYQRALHEYVDPMRRLQEVGNYPMNKKGELLTHTVALKTLMLKSTLLRQAAYLDIKDLKPEEGLAELDLMSYQQQQLTAVRRQVELGDFTAFQNLMADNHRELVLNGNPETATKPIDISKLSDALQIEFLNILKEKPLNILRLANCSALDDRLLKSLLDASPDLLEVDISAYSKYSEFGMGYLREQCSALQVLVLKDIDRINNLTGHFPELQQLLLTGSSVVRIDIKAPKLEILRAAECDQLVYTRTQSQVLRHVDLKKCSILEDEGLLGIADTYSITSLRLINKVNFTGCLKMQSREFLMTFPFLIGTILEKHPHGYLSKLSQRFKDLLDQTKVSFHQIPYKIRQALTYTYLQHAEFQTQLCLLLRSPHVVDRLNAILALENLGTVAPNHISSLIQSLSDENAEVLDALIHLIVSLAITDITWLPAIELALVDPDENIRAHAAQLINNGVLPNENIIDILQRNLQDPSGNVRKQSAFALGQIANITEPVITSLMNACSDLLQEVRDAVREALISQCNRDPSWIPSLIRASQSVRNMLSEQAIIGLGQLAISSPDVRNALLSILNTGKNKQRELAIPALGKHIDESDTEAIQVLRRNLSNDRMHVRIEAVKLLIKLHQSSDELIELLLQNANKQDWGSSNKYQVIEGLVLLLNEDPSMMQHLLPYFKKQNSVPERLLLIQAISQHIESDYMQLPYLYKAVEDTDTAIRKLALQGLQKSLLNPEVSEESLRIIINMLTDEDSEVVEMVHEIITSLPNTVFVESLMRERLEHYDPLFVFSACEIMFKMGHFYDDLVIEKIHYLLNLGQASITLKVLGILPLIPKCSDKTIQLLCELLLTSDVVLSYSLQDTLIRIAIQDSVLKDHLIENLNSDSLPKKLLAIRAITLQDELRGDHYEQITLSLNADLFLIQFYAACTLLYFVPISQQIFDIVIQALSSSEASIKAYALKTIATFGKFTDCMEKHSRYLLQKSQNEIHGASISLAQIGIFSGKQEEIVDSPVIRFSS